MPRYTVTEPHPTVATGSFTHSGRGGAGNYFRAPATTPASGVATAPRTSSPSTSRFYSGRGGSGNAHNPAERPVMSFDEEYVRQSSLAAKSVGHVGRGGAGNVFSDAASTRKSSDASSASSTSTRSGFLSRLISRE